MLSLRITISTDSPSALPTTGINVDVAAFIPFAASPSTLLVNPPSKERILTNIVTTAPKTHVIPDFKNLDSYLKNNCAVDCKYFVLKRRNNESKNK